MYECAFFIMRVCTQAGQQEPSQGLDQAIDQMCKTTKDLRRQLRKAVVDHVSDSFLETNVPLLILIDAAKRGDEDRVEEYAGVFQEHANKLVEVHAYIVSSSPCACTSRYMHMWCAPMALLQDVEFCCSRFRWLTWPAPCPTTRRV